MIEFNHTWFMFMDKLCTIEKKYDWISVQWWLVSIFATNYLSSFTFLKHLVSKNSALFSIFIAVGCIMEFQKCGAPTFFVGWRVEMVIKVSFIQLIFLIYSSTVKSLFTTTPLAVNSKVVGIKISQGDGILKDEDV